MSRNSSSDSWHWVDKGSHVDFSMPEEKNLALEPVLPPPVDVTGPNRRQTVLGLDSMYAEDSPSAPATPYQGQSRVDSRSRSGSLGIPRKMSLASPAAGILDQGTSDSPPKSGRSLGSASMVSLGGESSVAYGEGEGHPLSPIQLPGFESSEGKEIAVGGETEVEAEEEDVDEEREWRYTEQLQKDIREACSAAPPARLQSTTRFCKVLLVGEKGLGKTTLVKNLAAGFNPASIKEGCFHGDVATAFLDEPACLCTDICVPGASQGGHNFHYLLQDTPGLNSQEDVEVVLDYVRAQLQAYIAAEEDPRRSQPMSRLADPRVDVVLYLVAPHALKPQDIVAMTRLSLLVPVVPLLAKADAMTVDELAAFRKEVREELRKASEAVGRPIVHDFGVGAAVAAGALRDVPPFAVVGAATPDICVGPSWPVRVYPWGKVEALSSSHSDLLVLRKLLFEAAFESLKSGTEARYYAFRKEQLAGATRGWRLLPSWAANLSPWPQPLGEAVKQEVAVPPRALTQERRGLGLRRGSSVRTYSSLLALLVLGLPLVFSLYGELCYQRPRRPLALAAATPAGDCNFAYRWSGPT